MIKILALPTLILFAFSIVPAQKTNDAINQQIRSLKAEKTIALSYDSGPDTSKIMVTADTLDGKESSKAGIQAMNFGMAFFYQGKVLNAAPETINFTFWVLTKKPQFAVSHSWMVMLAGETLNLGDARYAAKSGENMEYLNFKISRADLTKIAAGSNVKFKLGNADFTFTPAQITIFKNLLAISDSH